MRSSISIQGSGLVRSVDSCAQITSVHLGDAFVATSAGLLSRALPGRRDISSARMQRRPRHTGWVCVRPPYYVRMNHSNHN